MTGYSYRFGLWLMHLFMVQVEVQVGAWFMHLFMVKADYRLFGTSWCMFDDLFMVQVDYRLSYRLMHGSGYWYRLFGAG